jgi:hypothetical protein
MIKYSESGWFHKLIEFLINLKIGQELKFCPRAREKYFNFKKKSWTAFE